MSGERRTKATVLLDLMRAGDTWDTQNKRAIDAKKALEAARQQVEKSEAALDSAEGARQKAERDLEKYSAELTEMLRTGGV